MTTLSDVTPIILAAGKGTRMCSDLPKILHTVGNHPMVGHSLDVCTHLNTKDPIVIVGHQAQRVIEYVQAHAPKAKIAIQAEQKGTGHAVMQAMPLLESQEGDSVILYADTPLLRADTLAQMAAIRYLGFDMVFLAFDTPYPTGYGRMLTDESGTLIAIIEEKEATAEQKQITLCNSGVVMVKTSLLASLLPQIDNNNQKQEYYLTDIVKIGHQMGLKAGVAVCDGDEVLGVNSQAELAHVELIFQTQKRLEAMQAGVTLQMPQTVFFSHDTQIDSGTMVEPNVYFGKNVQVGKNCHIKANSYLEGCLLENNVVIGPFARLREGTVLQEYVRIGNFVETKKAIIEQGAKINHLSYIGDAFVGKNVNIGAGTITCNYDGTHKHKTFIEEGAFIGSNSSLVAPINIGKGAYVGSSSVITKNVTAGALAITRSPQKEIANWKKRG